MALIKSIVGQQIHENTHVHSMFNVHGYVPERG
jgi:hypothetical protein